jgi:polar amino acid transport system permease protein
VLLTVFGNLGFLYPRLQLGLPFSGQITSLLGTDVHGTIWGVNANDFFAGFRAALLGLALSEAAYMAEIVRAGILAVDPGQAEAAQSLGMSTSLTMRRIVLPQAMRVIVPPTGNETIAMLKDTSLVLAVPVSNELFFQLEAVGTRTFQIFPMLVAACLWYLALSSVLMIGQHFIERRFSRGFGTRTNAGGPPIAGLSVGHGH